MEKIFCSVCGTILSEGEIEQNGWYGDYCYDCFGVLEEEGEV